MRTLAGRPVGGGVTGAARGWLAALLILGSGVWGWGAGMAEAGPSASSWVSADPLAAWHAWELRWILPFQRLGDWGGMMQVLTDLGPGKPMWLVIAALLCVVDVRLAARVFLMVVLCLWLRECLALVLQSPRPYWIEPEVRTFRDPPIRHPTFGLPSGHAMSAAAFWGYLAGEVRRPWAWWVAGAVAVAVAVSRVYLGLHFISDVVLGLLLGVLWVEGFRRVEERATGAWWSQPVRWRVAVAVGVGLGLVLVPLLLRGVLFAGVASGAGAWGAAGESARSAGSSPWTGGAVCGVLLALSTPVRWTGVGDPWRWRLGRLALGLAAAAVYVYRPPGLRLSALLDLGTGWTWMTVKFLTATIAGWGAWWLMPRSFEWLGVAKAEES